ncbi:MAG TPA: holo-[acyl-carrier-protein] synthase [Treponema sp.]|nr:holo-[acyl-carrier-protein] synthase [Treponema sp.]
MIYGIGTDITDVARFSKWVKDPSMTARFFNEREVQRSGSESFLCQHYAVRFAAKEAFSKALGTGITGFELHDIYIEKNTEGKPELRTQGTAAALLEKRCGRNAKIYVSLSHEKEFAVAFVVIEV